MTPRIAMFLQDLNGGGAERMMVNLCQGFVQHGAEVDLVLVRREGPYLAQVPATVRVVELGTRRVMYSMAALAGYLRRQRPTAMLATLVQANIAAVLGRALSGTGVRLVLREANHVTSMKGREPQRTIRLAYRLLPLLYPRADRIVAVSQGVADDLVQTIGIPAAKVVTLPNPVVTAALHEQARQPLQHPWLGPDQPPLMLATGRLEPQKGFDVLLRALALVVRQRPARLVILGEGSLRPSLESLAGELGLGDCVRLPGFCVNPYAWMARARLFVLSSRWEGSPNVLVEAMACGTPVVATDCPSGPRQILDGGRFGRLVPVDDVEALAQAMMQSLSTEADADAVRLRAQDFSAESVSAAYLRLLLEGTGP